MRRRTSEQDHPCLVECSIADIVEEDLVSISVATEGIMAVIHAEKGNHQ